MTFNSYIDFKIKETLANLRLMYLIIVAVLFSFGCIIFYLVFTSGNTGSEEFHEWFMYQVIFSLLFTIAGTILSGFIIKNINKSKRTEAILRAYTLAYITKYSLITFVVLTGYLGYLYFSKIHFFLCGLYCLIFLIASPPSKRRINKVIRA